MNEGRRFIAEVKKHECLWQTSHVAYGDKDVKTKAWQQVLETLYPEWDTLPIEDKMNKGNDVQRRWKNIRDSFKKELNKQQQASKRNIEKRKKYKYFDDLLFLIPQSAASEKSVQTTLLIKQVYNVDESDECDSNDTQPPIKQMHREREGISTPNDCVDTNNIAPSSSCESNQKTESFEKILIDFFLFLGGE
ncbi:uncharacterized protein LOC123300554 [Chrysoperla carnea]|uniref:uncharacterized protein LOC123300554 n=1 Tax=Chrysoperla carnea TaxID=189513 RepID=UPI001D07C017|nr:uncharacterized protein LOC123300554 [Chrysoperla carnea]